METCHDDKECVKKLLEQLLRAQKKIKKNKKDYCGMSCEVPLGGRVLNNTFPFILYCHCEPFKVEGVTTCFDEGSDKEKFVCFSTFIFKIVDVKGDCVILELLKFKNHHHCKPSSNGHKCSPCCQLHGENVDDLITTSVCITVELASFNGILCLPAIRL